MKGSAHTRGREGTYKDGGAHRERRRMCEVGEGAYKVQAAYNGRGRA
jgi:hypothetical protein